MNLIYIMQAKKKDNYSESSAPPSQIEGLFDHLRSFRRYPKGYTAIHFHFSILDRLHQQPHHRRAIATAFNKLLGPYEGKIFWEKNFDLFFVCKNCPQTKIEQAKLEALRAVSDSPILKEIIETSHDDEICDWYDLTTDYNKFYTKVEDIRANKTTITEEEVKEEVKEAPNLQNLMASLDPDKKDTIKPVAKPKVVSQKKKTVPQYDQIFPKDVEPSMGPMQLDKLERNIQNMDIFGLLDEQNICVVIENMPPQVIFTKKYVSLSEMNNSILPGYRISGDKWLFQRLTETFDKKLMQTLGDHDSFPDGVLSINMNVSSIFTKDFDKFIAKQKKLSAHPLILEITLFDIMSDLTEYFKAQEKINKLGCKICICNMDIQSLYVLNRELINVDFLKVSWNKNYLGSLTGQERIRISQAIEAQGKMRVVLSDCDSKAAISFGNDLGIVMYQGFEIDKLQSIL